MTQGLFVYVPESRWKCRCVMPHKTLVMHPVDEQRSAPISLPCTLYPCANFSSFKEKGASDEADPESFRYDMNI